jgi:hypothetical protein
MHMEHDLERALRRERPAPGLAARVFKRMETDTSRPVRGRGWRAVAATLMLLAMGGSWAVHHEMNRRAGEHARDQALLALHIAGAKVRYAQEQVRGIGSHSND